MTLVIILTVFGVQGHIIYRWRNAVIRNNASVIKQSLTTSMLCLMIFTWWSYYSVFRFCTNLYYFVCHAQRQFPDNTGTRDCHNNRERKCGTDIKNAIPVVERWKVLKMFAVNNPLYEADQGRSCRPAFHKTLNHEFSFHFAVYSGRYWNLALLREIGNSLFTTVHNKKMQATQKLGHILEVIPKQTHFQNL